MHDLIATLTIAVLRAGKTETREGQRPFRSLQSLCVLIEPALDCRNG